MRRLSFLGKLMTLGEKSILSDNRSSGFDYLRVILAVSVVAWHTIVITYGADFQEAVWITPRYRLLIVGILPAFFALSGFLVAGSLERSKTLVSFLYLRIIRIFPALIVEITLSALVLGPFLTSMSLHEYFTNESFYTYFLNCIGYVHYELPGVFLANPLSSIVNGQLWTIPFELECYIAITILALMGITLNKKLFSAFTLILLIYGVFKFFFGTGVSNFSLSGRTLVGCFLVGVFLYLQRHTIPYDKRLGWLAIVLSLVCFLTPNAGYLLPLPIAYATVFIGLTNPRKPWIMDSGDYSYGIFLYGFPIQQAVVSIGRFGNGWVNLAIAMPFVFLIAFLSWHLWEKKVATLKRYRPQIDKMFSAAAPGSLRNLLTLSYHRVRKI